MSTHLSKLCADFLRASYASHTSGKFKASHARELVAAFFGYKSHAALIADKQHSLDNIEEAAILVPDIPLMERRRARLTGLPNDVPGSQALADSITKFLLESGHFGGDVWMYESLEAYIMEVLLIDNDAMISDELSGAMAETNASFEDFPYYNDARIEDTGEALVVTVSGKHQGTQLEDKPFSGDTIDMEVQVALPRIAGKRGFLDFDIDIGGGVNYDWSDDTMHYEVPNMRPNEQFLQMTGGYRFGETHEQFQSRQAEIHAIRNRITLGTGSVRDVTRLSDLLGTNEDDEFGNFI